MKKLMSVFLFGALMLPVLAQADTMRETVMAEANKSTMSFGDMQKGYSNFPAVAFLYGRQVVQGYADDTFKPDNAVNRAELVKMVVGMMEGDPNAIANRDCFNDVKREWFAPYICLAKSKGWVDGYTGKMFKPANPVNRAEAMKIILNVMVKNAYRPTMTNSENALKMPSDADMSAWYATYMRLAWVKDLVDRQHVSGNKYLPADSMTRKEVAEMVFRTYLYMGERLETANLLADQVCFELDHSTMTAQERTDLWKTSYLDIKGYTQSDIDGLVSKYSTDDVVQSFATALEKENCNKGAQSDIKVWDDFKKFGTM
jgi:hypothetical protein